MNAQLCTKKLKVLYEFSRLLGQALNLQRTLGKVLSVLSDSLEMKRATITLRRENSDVLAIVASHGLTRQEMERGIYRIDEGVTGHIFRTAKPYVIPDISREPLFLNRTGARRIERERIAFLGVPILLQGGPIGVLNVDRLFGDEVSFEEDIEFLTVVSALIAQIVRLNEEVAERERGLLLANRSLKAEISEKYDHFFMVGSSPAMRRVQDIIGKVAKSPASVLLLGESGTGKTLVARIIHEMSRRADRPFIKVNCAALPENLLEAELFGFERGAFTGAERSKPGRIEEANGGSLFLDEIGELPLPLQSKLLRFLQEREFERLGSNRTLRVDVRIIAATNRDLERAAGEGQFREDLYYRLNVVPIQVPALRDRSADIPLLLDHFVRKFEKEYQKILRLSDETKRVLCEYYWPGNVRELENMIERTAILCESGRIDVEDLPIHIQVPAARQLSHHAPHAPHAPSAASADPAGQRTLKEIERNEIVSALERNAWVQSRAARELGLTLRQFGYRVKKLGLKRMIFQGRTT